MKREEFICNAMKEMADFFLKKENYLFFNDWRYTIDFFKIMILKLYEYYDSYALVIKDDRVLNTLKEMLEDIDKIYCAGHGLSDEILKKSIREFFRKFSEVFPNLWD
ncbi:MAG: hypothetical protein KatS3mg002_0412 [Candidatus Woesearchaeota archaeon]|nr:MAG: hypothetical protein KatS3mg002_0412 [Candidatus Woesearchaeota archaeon]